MLKLCKNNGIAFSRRRSEELSVYPNIVDFTIETGIGIGRHLPMQSTDEYTRRARVNF